MTYPPSGPYGGAPPSGGWGGAPYGYRAPDHPQGTTVLVLGILSIVLCQICGPFAWRMGKQALDEIDASGGAYGNRGLVQAGYICGIVGTVILGLYVALFLVYAVIIVAAIGASA